MPRFAAPRASRCCRRWPNSQYSRVLEWCCLYRGSEWKVETVSHVRGNSCFLPVRYAVTR